MKKAGEIVSDPNSLLDALLAASVDCVKILDLDGNLIFMTEGGRRLMEVSDFEAVRGFQWPDFWHGQGNTDAKAAVEAARQGKVGHFQGFATTMAGTPKWWDVTVSPIRDAQGKPERLLSISRDITESHSADAALRESEARFKAFAQVMPNQVWSATPDGKLDWFNDRIFAYSGLTSHELAGDGWVQIVHPDDVGAAAEKWAAALPGGASYETEFRLRKADGTFRWHLARATPIRDAAGAIARWVGTNTDIEDQKASEAQRQVLTAELEHRMKNIMAMVSAIANQTFRTATTKEEAQAIFGARLQTLNHAHDILTKSSWTSAPMQAVVEGALAPHRTGEGRIHIGGPFVDLTAKQSLSLALALHELATNAAKYGALSTTEGSVHIKWTYDRSDRDPSLHFSWCEIGGPTVSPPTRRGFGSRLIESTLSSDFGKVTIDFPPTGIVCSFQARAADLEQ